MEKIPEHLQAQIQKTIVDCTRPICDIPPPAPPNFWAGLSHMKYFTKFVSRHTPFRVLYMTLMEIKPYMEDSRID